VFDDTTGTLTFNTNDIINFPPGVYKFEITLTIGGQQKTVEYTLTLISPCAGATLTDLGTDEFSGQTWAYLLGDAQLSFPDFSPSAWVSSSVAPVNCGAPIVKFYKASPSRGTQPIEPSLFSTVQTGSEPFKFLTGPTSDLALADDYLMYWELCFASAPTNCVQASADFTVRIIDPCDPPVDYTP
jgi:hypothetical protein